MFWLPLLHEIPCYLSLVMYFLSAVQSEDIEMANSLYRASTFAPAGPTWFKDTPPGHLARP